METNEEKNPKIQSTTPPFIPTEPAPIPVPDIEPTVDIHFQKNRTTSVYYCPMHCEGDKTYDKQGNCPICGMRLVEKTETVEQ